jgi:hypothetical protein
MLNSPVHAFRVDPYLALPRHAAQDEPVRVGEVELQSGRSRLGHRGFSVGVALKHPCLRWVAAVTGEHRSNQRSGNQVLVPDSFDPKPLPLLLFLRSQKSMISFEQLRLVDPVGKSVPQIDLMFVHSVLIYQSPLSPKSLLPSRSATKKRIDGNDLGERGRSIAS